ncbi:hypothetical protein AAZV13_01G157150 [Glycine max]
MGCLIFERKELASKYEQVKASIDSSEFMCKHDSTMTLSALIEARKREESLKKAVGVTEALSKRESELNKKERELLDFQVKLASRESDETHKVTAVQEAELIARKTNFEAELQIG